MDEEFNRMRMQNLNNQIEYWRNQYYDEVEINEQLNEQIEELSTQINELDEQVSIKDLNHFIWKLKNDGLYNDQLDMFIEEYMKWHND